MPLCRPVILESTSNAIRRGLRKGQVCIGRRVGRGRRRSGPQGNDRRRSGAESIDFLDIVYKLEKSFGIEISRSELFPEDILSKSEYVTQGKVTAEGLALLKERMPFIDLTEFEKDPKVQDFGGLLTVNDLCNYVQTKL